MKIYEMTQIESVEVEVRLKDGRVEVWCPRMTEPIILVRDNSRLNIRAGSQPGQSVTLAVEIPTP